jgi:LemA protein
VEASWAQIDVQLKRRHSLIPNLVETVKGYAAHERGTLEAVVAARQAAVQVQGSGPGQQAEAENMLTQALGRMFALAEAYPNLKANENFRALQEELGNTEDKIAYARQFYNASIQTFNSAIQSFPANLVAGMGNFAQRPYFEAAGGERADVNVRF